MNKPTDYPLKSKNSDSRKDVNGSDLSYAMLRERASKKELVTDEMIRTARVKMDTAHTKKTKATQKSKTKLEGIRSRLRFA